MRLNKKGVSGVVTAVLLILLVIAAVGILAVVINNFVEQGSSSLTGSAACFETSFEVISATGETTPGAGDGSVTVRRISGGAVLKTIKVLVSADSVDGSTPQTISVGVSTVATVGSAGFTFTAGDLIDVSIASTLMDDTACPISPAGSITAK